MSILKVKDLSFSYGKANILLDITFEVNQGEVLCLFGPNGSGKTTMLDCILGLSKITNGSIVIDGKNISDLKPVEMSKRVAYVAQKHHRTFPYTVLEVVLMGRTAYTSMFSSPGKEDIEISKEALNKIGMYKLKDRIFTSLSGGEAQLVKIARALAQETKLIVFDEPTTHLDFRHELKVLNHIIRLVKEESISIIMATHSPNHAHHLENSGIKTKVAMIENGKFGAYGKPKNVLNEVNMIKIFEVRTKVLEFIENEKKFKYIVPIDLS